jgi:phosphatidylserine decarboxylase
MSPWWLLKYFPKNIMSRLIGRCARFPLPKALRPLLLGAFARVFKIRLQDAEFPLRNYRSADEFFTRRLKPCLRPIAGEDLVHPVDGTLTAIGSMSEGEILQAKGLRFSLLQFVVEADLAVQLHGGTYLTYYLCPTDYHRVHAPFAGELKAILHQPGTLWPVNPWSVTNVPRLFAINERLIFRFDTRWGQAAVVMVGATNVGEMSTPFAAEICTNRGGRTRRVDFRHPISVKKGDELGTFHLGSTVLVLLPEKASGELNLNVSLPQAVRLGESVLAMI